MTDVPAPSRDNILTRLAQPAVLVIAIWAIQVLDAILPGSFSVLGIRSWSLTGSFGILAAPLLHASWAHLISNTWPLLVMGGIASLDGVRRFWSVTLLAAIVSGVGAWVFNAPGTLTIGASGVVFGYFGYLLARAFVAPSLGRGIVYAIVAVVVAIAYGGVMLTGIFGAAQGVSWQAHLFGAVGGALAAWILRPRRAQAPGGRPGRRP
ncbi:rhomboid family intramembrane serine protease [Microbacterium indicum]|uniref:rhomboid family intramembrane serine protease n=1 Tax=Microbacterium indicum TaxID=358100 RepID=UPI00040E4C5B|nr:rhomboid family intramembrane serine protease [Microbacterium indicum]